MNFINKVTILNHILFKYLWFFLILINSCMCQLKQQL